MNIMYLSMLDDLSMSVAVRSLCKPHAPQTPRMLTTVVILRFEYFKKLRFCAGFFFASTQRAEHEHHDVSSMFDAVGRPLLVPELFSFSNVFYKS
jgi:hypothetical protein